MEEHEYKASFYDKISQLYPLYEKVKLAILLAENFDEKQELYIAPINQLRSALDHIFKSVCAANENGSCDYELKEAKEHMERSGYDALELLVSGLGAGIVEKLKVYDTETLTVVFPKYYEEIKPTITEIRQSVAKRRMERKTDTDKSFFAYFDEIMVLVDINKAVDKKIPSLHDYSKKKKKEKRRGRFLEIIIGIILAIVGFLLGKI